MPYILNGEVFYSCSATWILMQRKVAGGSVLFHQKNWAAYRDGFGAATGDDNYWMGLDKVYRLMQLFSVSLRVEVKQSVSDCDVAHIMLFNCMFGIVVNNTRIFGVINKVCTVAIAVCQSLTHKQRRQRVRSARWAE